MKVFSLFPREKIDINGVEIELEGYRVADSDYVLELMNARNELITLSNKYSKIKDAYEKVEKGEITELDLDDRVLEDLKRLKNAVDELQIKIDKVSYPLAQRGLKRALYKDEPEYKEAERENRLTEFIDSLPDIEIPPAHISRVVNVMLKLSKPELSNEMMTEKRAGGVKKKTPKKKKKPSGD